MIISNGLVFEKEGGFSEKNIIIENGIITQISTEKSDDRNSQKNIDATNMYVIPGLIDIHMHGCMGYDFCEGTREAIRNITEHQLSCGVTSICPTSMTFDEKRLAEIFGNTALYAEHDTLNYDSKDTELQEDSFCKKGARIVGINMEGPFIAKTKAGAQNPEYIVKPDINMFTRLQNAAGGLIRLVDLAPETEGAMEFIEEIATSVNVSIAHTNADYETSTRAFEKGANHVTHLYNAMPPFNHRKPGVIGAAADNDKVFVELIADGTHVDPAMVRATFKLFGDDRIVLVSDSMEACGMPDGEYVLGDLKVYVDNGTARLEDGTIAGSVSNLMDCVRTAAFQMNIPLEKAIKCATINPAKSIGIFDRYGSIDIGKAADIVILNKNLEIVKILIGGEVIA